MTADLVTSCVIAQLAPMLPHLADEFLEHRAGSNGTWPSSIGLIWPGVGNMPGSDEDNQVVEAAMPVVKVGFFIVIFSL